MPTTLDDFTTFDGTPEQFNRVCDRLNRAAIENDKLRAVLANLLACPALNMDDMETADLAAIADARTALGR